MENVNFSQSLFTVMLIIGFIMVIKYIFPPIHLINAPNREERAKKLNHFSNLQNMSAKAKVKMMLNMMLGVLLMSIAFAFQIYKGF